MTPHFNVIVVTYESGRRILNCLDSVAQRVRGHGEVVIVDNASTDDTVVLVETWASTREASTRTHVIRSPHNAGFGAACNLAVTWLESTWRESSSRADDEWLLFVNPDVVIETFDIERLANESSNPRVGAVALAQRPRADAAAIPRLRHLPTVTEGIASFSWSLLLPSILRADRVWWRKHKRTERVWPSGGFLAVRYTAWRAIGGFDERYFLFWEDVDFGRRLLEGGWICRPSFAATALHEAEDAEPGKANPPDLWKLSWALAGWMTYVRVWHGRPTARAMAMLTLLAQTLAIGLLFPMRLGMPRAPRFPRKTRELSTLARLLLDGLLQHSDCRDESPTTPRQAIRQALS